jgi:hypothetical protein
LTGDLNPAMALFANSNGPIDPEPAKLRPGSGDGGGASVDFANNPNNVSSPGDGFTNVQPWFMQSSSDLQSASVTTPVAAAALSPSQGTQAGAISSGSLDVNAGVALLTQAMATVGVSNPSFESPVGAGTQIANEPGPPAGLAAAWQH